MRDGVRVRPRLDRGLATRSSSLTTRARCAPPAWPAAARDGQDGACTRSPTAAARLLAAVTATAGDARVSAPVEPPLAAPLRRLRRGPWPRSAPERYVELARRVKLLSWLSLGWMTIEGAVAIGAGLVAGSIALIGFGLDSVIEGLASVIIIWRFTGNRVFSHAAEQRAQKLVAAQFFILAPYVGFESLQALVTGERPEASWVGIALAGGSVVLMPPLGIAKQRLADEMGSAATKGEGRQNMLCAYLAGALLVGLPGNALVGAWWLDAVVGLLIAGVAMKEGLESWRGDGCCVTSPLDGYAVDAACEDHCCRRRQGIAS